LEIKPLFIVVLDISGYTRFTRLHRASQLHAEKIIADLLQTMTRATEHPLILNKTEGDALLFYAETGDDETATGRTIVHQVLACFDSFYAELQRLVYDNGCICDACLQASDLRVKAIVHVDDTVIRDGDGATEISGEGVIVAHRLMKNALAQNEYVLMTRVAHERCGPVERFHEITGQETYDELGSIETVAYVRPTAMAPPAPSGSKLLAKLRGIGYVITKDVYLFKRMVLRQPAPGELRNLPE